MAKLQTLQWNAMVGKLVHPHPAIARAPGQTGGPQKVIWPPPQPPAPTLWVENGAIWLLPNLLVGFTNYPSVTAFFANVKSSGLPDASAPASWYAGSPFSATDMPALNRGSSNTVTDFFLLWPNVNLLSFAPTFLSQLPMQPIIPAPGPQSGPVMSPTLLSSFQASSPQGQGTFQAQYVLYAPWGPNPNPYLHANGGTSIDIDLTDYGWQYVPSP